MKTAYLALPLCLSLATATFAEWKLVPNQMLTPWAKEVKPETAWQEYPRPQMQRASWQCLNGLWDYAVTKKAEAAPEVMAGKILVPFAPEAALSGVGRLIGPTEALWYQRPLPGPVAGKRTLLHFEAVDYLTEVSVNGKVVGRHRGGHTPFSFDITAELKPEGNILLVKVLDETGGYQLHGKQALDNKGIWYTRVSGIWQTVWVENVAEQHIADLDYACSIKDGSLEITPKLTGAAADAKVRVKVTFQGKAVAETTGAGVLKLTLPQPKLWSPTTPHLYDLEVSLLGSDGAAVDTVKAYTALREFGKAKDAGGHWRYTLNGAAIFPWGPLDQGWWPDGLLTPPNEAAMVSDIEFLKAAGFNMIRKHIKIEPRRYYAACDRLGMMLWQDQVSAGYGNDSPSPKWTRMAENPEDSAWPKDAADQWVVEYKRMVEHLRDVPSISSWIPFNEAWGQHQTVEMGKLAIALDATRPINIASGGNFWAVGDVADHHAYPHPEFPLEEARFNDFIKVVGEFGGHGWPVDGHLWKKDNANWGYGGLPKTLDEWKERYAKSIEILTDLKRRGIAAGVYTQTTDVEVEINGLRTYDRLDKISPAWLKVQSDKLLAARGLLQTKDLAPISANHPQTWSYTTTEPAAGWDKLAFDAAAWKQGPGGFGSPGTPGGKVHTEWTSPQIWIRREFELTKATQGRLSIQIAHDEDATVTIDGEAVLTVSGHNGRYSSFPLPEGKQLSAGKHILGVVCRQTKGGQFIDAGIKEETVVDD